MTDTDPTWKDDNIKKVVEGFSARPSALATQVDGSHYIHFAIQPIEFIMKNEIAYAEGNIIKYVCRWKTKNRIVDLKKAQHYLQIMIEAEEKRLANPLGVKM